MKLSTRFLLTISIPVLFCLVIMSTLLYVINSNEMEDEYAKRLLAQAEQVRILLDNAIEIAKSDIRTLAANKLLEQYFMYVDVEELDYVEDVRATLEENFLTISKAKPKYASIRLFAIDGEGIVNITNQKNAYRYPDPRRTKWFANVAYMKKDDIHVSHVHPCPEHNLPSIFVNKLFYYWDTPRAIVSIHLHCQDYFADVLHEEELVNTKAEVHLVGRTGEIIAHSEPGLIEEKIGNPEIIASILSGHDETRIASDFSNTIPVKNVYISLGIKGAVAVITQNLSELDAINDKLLRRLFIIAVTVAVVLIILIYLTIKAIIKPLARLEKTTKKIAGGDLTARAKIQRNDEIGYLSNSFDTMAFNLQKSQEELNEALSQVKTLSGFLPICASCKKIRDDQGYWNQIEIYIRDHSEVEFSHGICPECAKKIYPDLK